MSTQVYPGLCPAGCWLDRKGSPRPTQLLGADMEPQNQIESGQTQTLQVHWLGTPSDAWLFRSPLPLLMGLQGQELTAAMSSSQPPFPTGLPLPFQPLVLTSQSQAAALQLFLLKLHPGWVWGHYKLTFPVILASPQ
jgi:hypothetical protein